MSLPVLVICAGGSGGHVFPGLAVADALRALADVRIVFLGSDRGMESGIVPGCGYELELLHAEPIKGGGPARAVKGALTASLAAVKSLALVRKLKPRAVLSIGGYAAGAFAAVAAARGIPVGILEPNAVMGLANKLLAPVARRAYLAWASSASFSRPSARRIVGVPLRSGFVPSPYPIHGRPSGSSRILVLGGSQGASALNDRLPEAARRIAADLGHAFRLEIVHQAGKDRDVAVREAYAREAFVGATVSPFLDDVARQIARADVVVARSGAGAVAEIAAIGRASILIPFPHAADDHQAKNAAALEAAGGAITIRQEAADAMRIARELTLLLHDGPRRQRMADAARAAGRPNAARAVAEDLLRLACIDARRAEHADETSRTNGHARAIPSSEIR
jgi:UDP-N-acetylglucosamine--N-acetylmuramyl-(pentapeptide) pyrophosphoryl-undecaprenol N-acetylglucosamine transferase